MTATLCAAEDPERVKGWGGRAIAVRLVLFALGQAAMVSGSSTIEFGTRNLALHSALESGTFWGRLRGEQHRVRRLAEAGYQRWKVVGKLVQVEAAGDLAVSVAGVGAGQVEGLSPPARIVSASPPHVD